MEVLDSLENVWTFFNVFAIPAGLRKMYWHLLDSQES
jgi:hypothetical protein